MPDHYIQRGSSSGGPPANFINLPQATAMYVDGATDELVVGQGASGTTGQVVAGYVSATETGTTSTTLRNYGLSNLTPSSSGATKGYNLAAPAVNLQKSLVVLTPSTSGSVITVSAPAGVTFDGTNATLNFASVVRDWVNLQGISSTRWVILSNSTGVTLSA